MGLSLGKVMPLLALVCIECTLRGLIKGWLEGERLEEPVLEEEGEMVDASAGSERMRAGEQGGVWSALARTGWS